MKSQHLCRAGWVVLGFVLAITSIIHAEEKLTRYEFTQIRMGIPVNIIVYASDEPTANEATNEAYRRIREIDRTMSDYDPDSELMKLCDRAKPGHPEPVSDSLMAVLSQANALSKQTNGAFDVTVSPVVKLWRRARRKKELPASDQLEAARERVDYRQLKLNVKEKQVTFQSAGIRIDLGGIAKGYAADEALRILKCHGLSHAMVDAGGDIVVGDAPPGKPGWTIEIEKLKTQTDNDNPPQLIVLSNASIATSGDAYQFVEIDGIRYSHIIDPKTGIGLTTTSSVTIIAPDGITADSYASAASILGPKKGIAFIERHKNTEAWIVHQSQTGDVTVHASSGFKNHFQKTP